MQQTVLWVFHTTSTSMDLAAYYVCACPTGATVQSPHVCVHTYIKQRKLHITIMYIYNYMDMQYK